MFAWLATALRWFLAMSSQWRRDGDGRATGLDYGPAEATARLAGLDVGPDDFAHLQILEQAVLAELRGAVRQRSPRIGGPRR
ncbi:Phage related hypothetical protein [Roseovarius azorensis]|uniref:Uncharacterized protein n=1 Tax=Roseovarius azorensis TaxID=1287727 RepID=A0A1H7GDU9_9RHOB|nr:Phage related hypothetical protein [Roseovarius azorensis]